MTKLFEAIKDMYESMGMQYRGEEGKSYELMVQDLPVFFEMDDDQETVLITTIIGEVPAGTYRAEVLREALRHNGFPPPAFGKFGYLTKIDSLIYFHKIPIHRLSKDRLIHETPPFVQTAMTWRAALASASVPTAVVIEPGQIPSFLDVLGLEPEKYGIDPSLLDKLL